MRTHNVDQARFHIKQTFYVNFETKAWQTPGWKTFAYVGLGKSYLSGKKFNKVH